MRLVRAAIVFTIIMLLTAAPAAAQTEPATAAGPTVTLTTPYTAVAVEPGNSVTFNLKLAAPAGDHVTFDVSGVPDGWTATIKGGGLVVEAVDYDPDDPPFLKLSVSVPDDAADGTYPLTVVADGDSGTATLPLTIRVASQVGGGVTLTTDFPDLKGPSGVKFSWRLQLHNDTTQEIQFGLDATGPDSWNLEVKPSGQSLASTVTVDAGGSTTINVEATPPKTTPAGDYTITVTATGGNYTASADLLARITGSYEMTLSTVDQRLNADVVAGKPTDVQLVVANTGTAPLTGVGLRATAPSGWETSFDPQTIDVIQPGSSATVTLTITPSTDAVAGDYLVSVSARTDETNDSVELRTTVKTSTVWGLVGVGLIIVVLGGLGAVFRRYGRR